MQRNTIKTKATISVAMLANFLTIGLLGLIYYFSIASKGAPIDIGEFTIPVNIMEVPRDDSSDSLEQENRIVVIGSNASEIEKALIQCKQYDNDCDRSWYEDELERSVSLQPFALDETEVTVAQFSSFAKQNSYLTDAEYRGKSYKVDKPYDDYAVVSVGDLNWRNMYSENSANLPVAHVTLKDAATYCQSVQKRLPTEAEWEYVAGGYKRSTYPWGQQWDDSKLYWGNVSESGGGMPVASYPATDLGHYDLAGGVSEWTSTTGDSQHNAFIKGASRFDTNVANARIPVRRLESIDYSGEDVGFRCVKELDNWPELN